MSLKLKTYVEDQKKNAQTKLEARRAFLKEKGLSDEVIRKDVTIRKLKADVRKSDVRLSSIAAMEKQNQALAQAKAEKKAAGKTPKVKEAKEPAPEKKEKKAKKEKPEKAAKSQGKKEKPEEKTVEETQAQ